jgi:hypothetical protein
MLNLAGMVWSLMVRQTWLGAANVLGVWAARRMPAGLSPQSGRRSL